MLKRAISGAVFLIIFLTSLLWNMYSMIGFFFIVSILASSELFRLLHTPDLDPQEISGGVFAKIVFLLPVAFIIGMMPLKGLSLILIPFLIIPVIELFRAKKNALFNMVLSYFPAFYISIPFVLLIDISFIQGYFDPKPVLGFFILIWVYDTGAYLSGRMAGRHKLFERISPKKTWEGLIGGGIISFLAGVFVIARFIPEMEVWKWAVVSLIVILFGTLGDLIESMVKRNAGVKDSGNIMPGHGGMLDRFDSALFAAPFFWLFLQWI